MLSWPNVGHRVGGEPLLALAAHATICHMPVPTNERRALERERDELPAHVTNYQRELDATPQENRERRERLEWQIRRVEKRMAEVHARMMAAGR
jgi:hypothetical protein